MTLSIPTKRPSGMTNLTPTQRLQSVAHARVDQSCGNIVDHVKTNKQDILAGLNQIQYQIKGVAH